MIKLSVNQQEKNLSSDRFYYFNGLQNENREDEKIEINLNLARE